MVFKSGENICEQLSSSGKSCDHPILVSHLDEIALHLEDWESLAPFISIIYILSRNERNFRKLSWQIPTTKTNGTEDVVGKRRAQGYDKRACVHILSARLAWFSREDSGDMQNGVANIHHCFEEISLPSLQ